jgi:dTDP-4-amino-4,6-dideoxygalactose transaminase
MMRVPFYDIKAQYTELQSELDAVTHEVLSSGAYAPGKYVTALESTIAAAHGVKHGIAVNSGTDALRIIMDAAGIGPGDEVITTAFTFVASTETIVQTGATPVFVDVEPNTTQIDVSKIEAAITPRTKAILPIHLFGQLCDVKALQAIAEKHNLIVLEDSAQALLSHYEGTFAGNFGLATGISFYVTQNLGAAGDGGMILTNDDTMNEKCRSIRVHGMGRERYYYDYLGYTSRLDEIQGAILGVKFTRLPAWNTRRSELAKLYFEGLAGTGVHLPVTLDGNNHTFHQFTIRTDRRDELQAFLKEREVDSMIYYPVPLHWHKPYSHIAERGSLPVTDQISKEVLSLPIHPHLRDEQVQWVAECVREFNRVAV